MPYFARFFRPGRPATAAPRAGSAGAASANEAQVLDQGAVLRSLVQGTARMSSDGNRSTFWIATDALARDGLILDPDGLDVSAFRNNPVVLWMHGWSGERGAVPIARCVDIVRKTQDGKNGWVATIEWEGDEFSQLIRAQVKSGTLSTASVRWKTKELRWEVRDEDEVPVVTRSELLELSVVSVPGDADALVIERAGAEPAAPTLTTPAPEVAALRSEVAALREEIRSLRPATADPAPDEDERATAPPAPAEEPEDVLGADLRSAEDATPTTPEQAAQPTAPVFLVSLDDLRALAADRQRQQREAVRTAALRQLGKA